MLKVRDIMTTEVVAVTPETTMLDAMRIFADQQVTGAPVVDGTRVVGVVSVTDLIEFGAFEGLADDGSGEAVERADWNEELLAEDVEREDEAASALMSGFFGGDIGDLLDRVPDADTPDAEAFAGHDVAEVMTRKVLSVSPDDDATAAAAMMRQGRVHRVLVMEEGRLAGIVTTSDLSRAIASGRLAGRTPRGPRRKIRAPGQQARR